MPRKILISFTLLVWTLAITEMVGAETLTINIEHVHTDEGVVMLQIMSGEEEFKGEATPVASIMQRAQNGAMSYQTTLPPGTYAVRIMHDVNGNGELDANFIGIPREPWAFSNNATGNMGPPSWDDVKFEVKGDTVQDLRLNK
ncbi:MAG: DUF2141 domain-containing protein [Pseudomonadota bacterium]